MLAARSRFLVAHALAHALAQVLVMALGGCGGGGEPSQPVAHATPRDDDPELQHSWQLQGSLLHGGDLGSDPPALADALMAASAIPSISHRSAIACAQQGTLAGATIVALRLTIGDAGTVLALEGDPAGPAATCLAEAVRAELAALAPLPAGVALLLLRFHADAPR